MYRVILTDAAKKQLKALDKSISTRIVKWLGKNIDGAANPRAFGHALSENLSGYWRYRIGSYRVVCVIKDDVCEVIAIKVGHRSRVYE